MSVCVVCVINTKGNNESSRMTALEKIMANNKHNLNSNF